MPPTEPGQVRSLRTAISAVLYGVIWNGFDGPTGLSKDEALEYAVELAHYVEAQLNGD